MKLTLHIGLPSAGTPAMQSVLDAKRNQLASKGVLYSASLGRKNHTRLFMAVTDPDHIDPLRVARGFAGRQAQARLHADVLAELKAEIARSDCKRLILSAEQLAISLYHRSELVRLREFLDEVADEVSIVCHVQEQARAMLRNYIGQVMAGRTTPLTRDLELMAEADWETACLNQWPKTPQPAHKSPEVVAPAFWLDYGRLVERWEDVFGEGRVTLRPALPEDPSPKQVMDEVCTAFDLPRSIGKADPVGAPTLPSAASLTRARLLNEGFAKLITTGKIIPRRLWRILHAEASIPGPAPVAGQLAEVSARFKAMNAELIERFPDIAPALVPDDPISNWQEADPDFGFRASQYLAAYLPRIEKATQDTRREHLKAVISQRETAKEVLSPEAEQLLPPLAKANFERLRGGPFAPSNRLAKGDLTRLGADYPPAPARKLPKGSTGKVIVGCMKNEGPYILEWVAYHRAIGVDNFLIYTNGCEDGTDEILDRLQEMGVLQHRLNDDWKGQSPQQYALNQSKKEPVIRKAEWLIHIDVDEFINVRCGNGTLDDFLELVPEATNVAMTWRMFGHNGVTDLSDDLVIDQFTRCAPSFCPKPHTAWGFKTMTRNLGLYGKLSCHRPNKPDQSRLAQVAWANGSAQLLGQDLKTGGWRSSKGNIGYDLLQLNHYALRSAESFLIKRQRGRALHVDRSIGLNYWIRMDWNDHEDHSIRRNSTRVKAELDRLKQDPELAKWHDKACAWHRAKADELHKVPEFEKLYQRALTLKLTAMERVSYALALDMES
ncbi:glycosyltransferase family 2 protein [Actibacterium pelagium]|uniref:Glycosyl transferase family 2 n=1 Tax=Actibacterium pelagium TaxID=2029103 RepID=A0A917AF69_9RHOB|nr:glycosyltransferase family 2 protein [Actibacterium pelagium]GGE46055.1 hypothetical protein GCM10011517_12170 [Actibacterium pelagium]